MSFHSKSAIAVRESDYQSFIAVVKERPSSLPLTNHNNHGGAKGMLDYIAAAEKNYVAVKRYKGKKKKYHILFWDGNVFWHPKHGVYRELLQTVCCRFRQYQWLEVSLQTGCKYYMMRGGLTILRYKGNKLILPKEEM